MPDMTDETPCRRREGAPLLRTRTSSAWRLESGQGLRVYDLKFRSFPLAVAATNMDNRTYSIALTNPLSGPLLPGGMTQDIIRKSGSAALIVPHILQVLKLPFNDPDKELLHSLQISLGSPYLEKRLFCGFHHVLGSFVSRFRV